MDITGGYIGLGILIVFALFFAIFGGVDKDRSASKTSTEHRLRK